MLTESSNLSQTDQESIYLGALEPSQFIMGFNMIPKLSRQKKMMKRPRTQSRPKRTSESYKDLSPLGFGLKANSKKNLRDSNSTPPTIPTIG